MNLFGEGATKLLFKMKKIRFADLAFFGFLFLVIFVLASTFFFNNYHSILLLLFYFLLVSSLHIYRKFEITKFWKFILAVFVNSIFILVYYFGRIKGFFKKEKQR
jgi:hypothetical protein